jgi:hypothetical protein
VRRFARAASPDELLTCDGTGRRASILDEHASYLHERWNSGCTNAALLWQEIRARGYQGSRRQVRGYLARFRASTAAPAPAPPKARAVTAWIMTHPGRLADADKASLDAILAASPELASVTASDCLSSPLREGALGTRGGHRCCSHGVHGTGLGARPYTAANSKTRQTR